MLHLLWLNIKNIIKIPYITQLNNISLSINGMTTSTSLTSGSIDTVKPHIVNTSEMGTSPIVNTFSQSHFNHLHYEKTSEMWTPLMWTLLPWCQGVHIFEVSPQFLIYHPNIKLRSASLRVPYKTLLPEIRLLSSCHAGPNTLPENERENYIFVCATQYYKLCLINKIYTGTSCSGI